MSAKTVQSQVRENTQTAREVIKAYWDGILEDLNSGRDVIYRIAGKSVAVVIPYDDYRAIQEALEDYRDIRDAEAALEEMRRDPSSVKSWAEVKKELIAEGLLDDKEAEAVAG